MVSVGISFFDGSGGSGGASSSSFDSKIYSDSILWHDPIDLVNISGSLSYEDIPEDLLNFEPECRA